MNQDQRDVNIVLCGSARVGKSSLINAICQQSPTKSNISLDTCNRQLKTYQMEYKDNDQLHRITFWDMPGIESWNETDVRDSMMKLIVATKPLCLIYCASPGSFTKLAHVEWLASECATQKIFCALVCTNMWSGPTRQIVLKEFHDILRKIHPNAQSIEENKISYFGRFALCTMVNSETYTDDDIGIRKDPSGINELISGVAKSLDEENRCTWFRVVAQNQSFWSQMNFQSNDLLSLPVEEKMLKNSSAKTSGQRFPVQSFVEPMGFEQNFDSSTRDSDSWQHEIPSNSESKQTVVNDFTSDHSPASMTNGDKNSSSSNSSSVDIPVINESSNRESQNKQMNSGSFIGSMYDTNNQFE